MPSYYQNVTFIFQNIQTVIGIIGIVGNVLGIMVFLGKRFRKYSYTFYWIALMLSDTILLVHTIRHWFNNVLGWNIDLLSPILCKINEYQPHVSSCISGLTVSIIAIDRYVTIVYRNQFVLLRRKWFRVSVISAVIFYSLLVNLKIPLNYRYEAVLRDNLTSHVCYLPYEVLKEISIIYNGNLIATNVILNNILTVKMIYFLVSSRRRSSVNKPYFRSTIRDRKFVMTSIGLNITCLVSNLPLGVYFFIAYYFKIEPDLNQMLFTICVAFVIFDNAAPFFINFFFNSIFYDEFLSILHLKRKRSFGTYL
jgi:hypothetical protein